MILLESRRTALKHMAGATGLTLAGTTAARSVSVDGVRLVDGTKTTKIEYNPTSITVTVSKSSPKIDSVLTTGRDEITKERVYDRQQLENDSYPNSGVEERSQPWRAYVGTETQWANEFETEAGILCDEEDRENLHDWPVWTCEELDNDCFERKHPIQVVFDLKQLIYHVIKGAIEGDDWSELDADATPPHEHRRFAWNRTWEGFEETHASFGKALNWHDRDEWGTQGRYHVQSWSFDDTKIGFHCHDDTEVPHSVEEYTSAINELHQIWDGNSR